MVQEGKRYIFKKDYICSMGKINEGREINLYRGVYLMDGIMIPVPYDKEIDRLMNDDNFINEYIDIREFMDSRYVI